MNRYPLPLLAGCTLLLNSALAAAQGYPNRPIRLIVPYPPGAGTDFVGRAVGQKLSEALGQPVLIENRGGAAGVVGTDAVAKSAPDGYTIGLITGSFAMVPSLQKLPYDPIKDFTPLTTLATVPNVLVVHPSLPAKSVQELIRLIRSRPGQLTFATSGNGGVGHLTMELMRMKVPKLDLVHVAYKGNSQALVGLLGGHVTMMFVALPSAKPYFSPPRLRALAVTSGKRSPAEPDVPTMHEAGVTGYDFSSEFGLTLPARTPADIVARLNTELVRILKLPDLRERLATQGAEAVGSTPEGYAAAIRSDITKWAQVIQTAGIKGE